MDVALIPRLEDILEESAQHIRAVTLKFNSSFTVRLEVLQDILM
jgi:hypothetical protein